MTVMVSLALALTDTASPDAARHVIETRGMQLLLIWAVLNIGSGVFGRFATAGVTRYFFEMNALWNVVNATIAVTALVGLTTETVTAELAVALGRALHMERVLLVNIGLDAAYIVAGGLLRERGLRRDSGRLRGYGRSLFLQGGFLFAFDIALFALTHQQTSRLLVDLTAG